MFRPSSISVILLALAICAASPSRCFAQAKVDYLSIRWGWLFSQPLWPTPKRSDESAGCAFENPFDPFPDESELAELDSILVTWDRVFAERPFNSQNFRQWEYDTVFGPSDPDRCKAFREGVFTRATPQRWSMRETRAIGYAHEPSNSLVLPTQTWTWDEELFASWSSQKSKPLTLAPLENEKYEPPLVAVLAFCGNGQARELAHRYWMRVVSRELADEQPRIELRPRLQMDRGWKEITILLASDRTPSAVEIVVDKKHRIVFEFTKRTNASPPDERDFKDLVRRREYEERIKKIAREGLND